MFRKLFTIVVTLCPFVATSRAEEKPNPNACRSVHLGYSAAAGNAFYVEANVKQSAEGSYFCAAGFSTGYFGIQELTKGKKVVIFSIWDPTSGDDPKSVPAEKRAKMLFQGEGVRIGRFGGEGTGGQSFFDYDWKIGNTYRFLVTAQGDESTPDRVVYAAYFYVPEKKEWKHLATFSTIAKKKQLDGYYSFVEDFRRNKISAAKVHEAEYGNAWVRTLKGDWTPSMKVRFTGDSNPLTNIDAGLTASKDRFYLKTGGATENQTTKLKEKIELPTTFTPEKPSDLPIK